MGCHALLQGIFLTQGSNLHLLVSPALAGRFLPSVPAGKSPFYFDEGKFPYGLCFLCVKNALVFNFSLKKSYGLEEEMATHSSILAWRIPWTGEPGRLQSVGSQELDMTWQLNCYYCADMESQQFYRT